MYLKSFSPSELAWDLNFSPLRPWPDTLPAICTAIDGRYYILAGFERQGLDAIEALVIEKPVDQAFEELWPLDSLRPLERLRCLTVLNKIDGKDSLLQWPLELQNFFDERDLSPKALKPLEFLIEWKEQLLKQLLVLTPSSSQTREIIDLLCDLKFDGKSWNEIEIQTSNLDDWMKYLKSLRFPRTVQSDSQASVDVNKISWPRGVKAKWERTGDQAGIVIQTKISNHLDWTRFQEGVQKIELKDLV